MPIASTIATLIGTFKEPILKLFNDMKDDVAQGWLYLTIIMDLADRKIIGWSLNSSLKTRDTVVPAWLMAVGNRPITSRLFFHSDRGIHYACDEFKDLLSNYPLLETSMSRNGVVGTMRLQKASLKP